MAHDEFDYRDNFFRAYYHSIKALKRGDYPNSVKWLRLAERHMAIARRYEDLAGQRHKPKPGKIGSTGSLTKPPGPQPSPSSTPTGSYSRQASLLRPRTPQ